MSVRRNGAALAASILPSAARAHEAFGELGPFYGGLLHPLADPAQGLILVALGVVMARQPRSSVRVAYAAVLVCLVMAVALHPILSVPDPAVPLVGVLVAALGFLAMTGLEFPVVATAAIAGLLAALAGSAGDILDGPRAMALAACGSVLGAALIVLFVWSALDLLQSRLGRIAGAVAGSWLAAIGVMAAALPGIAA